LALIAVVAAACVVISVREVVHGPVCLIPKPVYESTELTRSPTVAETLRRTAFWGPAAIAAKLPAATLVRCLTSRRHTERPVG
jgi:hypothetical protein